MGFDLFMICDLIIAIAALYIVYAAFMLKFKNEVSVTLMLPKDYAYKKCRDIDGYRDYMFPRTLGCGIALFLTGGASTLGDMYPAIYPVTRWFFILSLGILALYIAFSRKGLRDYYA